MHSLIIAILAIALMSSALLVGSNNININYFSEKHIGYKITTDIANLSTGFSKYKDLKGIYLPETNWGSQISETTRYVVNEYTDGSQWSYKKVSNKYYFCLSNVNMSEMTFNAAKKVNDEKEYSFINSSCGADSGTPAMTTPSSFPAQVALTYWIK